MDQEIFEGDISEFSPKQLECISGVLNKKGFREAIVTINSFGEVGDNYVASVKKIIAEKDGETFKIIAKVAPRAEQLRNSMNVRTMFLNEHVIYTEVLPKFTELENSAGIPTNEQFRYAACYGTMTEDCDELILLEDLSDSGFVMLDRFQPLTDGDIRIILESLARLHSLSYALKNKDSNAYHSFGKKLLSFGKVVTTEREEITRPFFEMLENTCLNLCEQKYKEYIRGSVSRLPELGRKISDFDDSRFSVILQADLWTNNVLFQLQEGKSSSCCMIDYQVSRVSSPVADLLYMILTCTDHQTRKDHFSDWIDFYHSELDKRLFEFGLKVNYFYPRDQLDADLKRHGKFSFATATILAFTNSQNFTPDELKTAMENFDKVENSKTAMENFDEVENSKIAMENFDEVENSKTAMENFDEVENSKTAMENFDEVENSKTAMENFDEVENSKTAMENFDEVENLDMAEAATISNADKKANSNFKSRVEGILETCLTFGLL